MYHLIKTYLIEPNDTIEPLEPFVYEGTVARFNKSLYISRIVSGKTMADIIEWVKDYLASSPSSGYLASPNLDIDKAVDEIERNHVYSWSRPRNKHETLISTMILFEGDITEAAKTSGTETPTVTGKGHSETVLFFKLDELPNDLSALLEKQVNVSKNLEHHVEFFPEDYINDYCAKHCPDFEKYLKLYCWFRSQGWDGTMRIMIQWN
jgi:hypothetical protein